MRLKKFGKGAGIAALVSATFLGLLLKPSYDRISPYLRADIQSEYSRVATPGKPKSGLRGLLVRTGENVKTARDFLLFARNDNDGLPEYDIEIDKQTNTSQVYLEGELVREFLVGTGRVLRDNKTRFGEYVTPRGKYMVINKKTKVNPNFYGKGMIQLSGPWAPHIAIHGTSDMSKIGAYRSNGCVNVTNQDLEWLLENIGIGSRVYVK